MTNSCVPPVFAGILALCEKIRNLRIAYWQLACTVLVMKRGPDAWAPASQYCATYVQYTTVPVIIPAL